MNVHRLHVLMEVHVWIELTVFRAIVKWVSLESSVMWEDCPMCVQEVVDHFSHV